MHVSTECLMSKYYELPEEEFTWKSVNTGVIGLGYHLSSSSRTESWAISIVVHERDLLWWFVSHVEVALIENDVESFNEAVGTSLESYQLSSVVGYKLFDRKKTENPSQRWNEKNKPVSTNKVTASLILFTDHRPMAHLPPPEKIHKSHRDWQGLGSNPSV